MRDGNCDNQRSAGGQLEQPCDVYSSTSATVFLGLVAWQVGGVGGGHRGGKGGNSNQMAHWISREVRLVACAATLLTERPRNYACNWRLVMPRLTERHPKRLVIRTGLIGSLQVRARYRRSMAGALPSLSLNPALGAGPRHRRSSQ